MDACIRLTAQGVEDGIEYPREKRAFDSRYVDVEFTMPTLEKIEDTVLHAQRDTEKSLLRLVGYRGLMLLGPDNRTNLN